MRNTLIMQDALDRRQVDNVTDDPDKRPGTALLCAMLMNQGMPERFKLSDVQLDFRRMNTTSHRSVSFSKTSIVLGERWASGTPVDIRSLQ